MKLVRGVTLLEILQNLARRDPETLRALFVIVAADDFPKGVRCGRFRAQPTGACDSPRSQTGEHHGWRLRRGAGDGLGCSKDLALECHSR